MRCRWGIYCLLDVIKLDEISASEEPGGRWSSVGLLGTSLMKTTGPTVIKGAPFPFPFPFSFPSCRGLCFIGWCRGPGARGPRGRSCGGPKSSVISERLMVASRCFIIFSKCKFVHGPRASSSLLVSARGSRGGPYKTFRTLSPSPARRGPAAGSTRGLESRIVDCRRQFMVLSRPADQLAP